MTEDLSHFDVPATFRVVQKVFQEEKKQEPSEGPSSDEAGEVDIEPPDYRADLLGLLKSLRPSGFERLCQRLLRESGFQQVVVTGRTGDGGIDGYGVLALNPFVSFNVLFQCKRYNGAVTPSQIRDFRGAMMGRADKGIILTTGTFTLEAKKEARRDGAYPIELVDHEKLVQMFEQLQLGLVPRNTFELILSFSRSSKRNNT